MSPDLAVQQDTPAAALRVRRLLFVINDAEFFVSHRLPVGEGARSAGYEVHVAAAASPALDSLRTHGFVVHPLPLRRSAHGPFGEAAALWAIACLYRRVRPDVVHHVTVKPVLYGSMAARIAGIPAVVNAVSGLGYVFLAEGAGAAVRRAVVISAYRLAFAHPNARVIFQNDTDAAMFAAHGALRPRDVVFIRGSGVDLERYMEMAEPSGPPLVVLAARMLRDKGVVEFVEAARRLRREGVEARFALVGDTDPGNPAAISRALLEGWQRDGVVEWWGRRGDMPAVLAQASVVCLPSYREGMPKVLLEAAACGRAVVTTDVPGCRDAIVPGVTGLLAAPRDPAALADAIGGLLADPEMRRNMGRAARVHAERCFDVRAVVEQTLALYEELTA